MIINFWKNKKEYSYCFLFLDSQMSSGSQGPISTITMPGSRGVSEQAIFVNVYKHRIEECILASNIFKIITYSSHWTLRELFSSRMSAVRQQ